MITLRPDVADRLAAEYVLGTLRGGARRRFETLMAAHPSLREAVARWPVVAPPPRVWQAIEARLDGRPQPAAAPRSIWSGLAFWRGWSALATAAAVVMAVLLAQPTPLAPPVVVVLAAPEGANAFVASVSADGRSLVVRPLAPLDVDATRALELWAVPGQGAPRSLGLIQLDRTTVLQREQVLDGTAALAVSLEPPGGSPTGAPTGPILYTGAVSL
jgi:anti-sigma-K factor RskA